MSINVFWPANLILSLQPSIRSNFQNECKACSFIKSWGMNIFLKHFNSDSQVNVVNFCSLPSGSSFVLIWTAQWTLQINTQLGIHLFVVIFYISIARRVSTNSAGLFIRNNSGTIWLRYIPRPQSSYFVLLLKSQSPLFQIWSSLI